MEFIGTGRRRILVDKNGFDLYIDSCVKPTIGNIGYLIDSKLSHYNKRIVLVQYSMGQCWSHPCDLELQFEFGHF